MDPQLERREAMTEWLAAAGELFKSAPRLLASLPIAALLLLAVPDPVIEFLHLETLTATYAPWLGVVAILGAGWGAVELARNLATHAELVRRASHARHGARRLQDLTDEEKEILAGYLRDNSRTQPLSEVAGLLPDREPASAWHRLT
jgi:hypothetical protein